MNVSKVKNAYHTDVCSHKMAFLLDNWLRKLLQNPRKIVREYIHEGNTVIDLGCGPGFFSTAMAHLVGEKGKVIAVDLQVEMLAKVRKKATLQGLINRIDFHHCSAHSIGLSLPVRADFILAYYMVHETPDARSFLSEVRTLLKEEGHFLVVEPKMHVSAEKFSEMIGMAAEVGLKVVSFPVKKGGRSVLFKCS